MGQAVGTDVGEGQQFAVPLGHPPFGARLGQFPDGGGDAEVALQIGFQILGGIGNRKAVLGDEGVDEGLAAEGGQGLGVLDARLADQDVGTGRAHGSGLHGRPTRVIRHKRDRKVVSPGKGGYHLEDLAISRAGMFKRFGED